MTNKQTIIIESNAAGLARKGAEIFSRAAKESVEKKGRFAVAISGGSTPRSMHSMLGKEPFYSNIPWGKTDIFWADERCVPSNHPDSNFGAAKKDFLDLVPIPKEHIHPLQGGLSPKEGALWYQQKLIKFFQRKEDEFPLFDLIFLGIGTDGHTASLFPGQSALNEMKKWVVAQPSYPDLSSDQQRKANCLYDFREEKSVSCENCIEGYSIRITGTTRSAFKGHIDMAIGSGSCIIA